MPELSIHMRPTKRTSKEMARAILDSEDPEAEVIKLLESEQRLHEKNRQRKLQLRSLNNALLRLRTEYVKVFEDAQRMRDMKRQVRWDIEAEKRAKKGDKEEPLF